MNIREHVVQFQRLFKQSREIAATKELMILLGLWLNQNTILDNTLMLVRRNAYWHATHSLPL